MWEILQTPELERALLIAMIAGPVMGLLGTFITLRGMAFFSDATDLEPVPAGGSLQLYERDMATGVTTLVSVNSSGSMGANAGPNGFPPAQPAISAGVHGQTQRPPSTSTRSTRTDVPPSADITVRSALAVRPIRPMTLPRSSG